MSTNLLGELAANNGTYTMSNAGSFQAKIDRIMILETASFEWLTINGVNVVGEYTDDLDFPTGAIITPKDGLQFDTLGMRYGKICIILG